MELKLDIYETRLCRKIEKTVTANDFGLSTGICEDVLDIVDINIFTGGIEALSVESQLEIIANMIKNAYPFFKDLIVEIFEITEDEAKRVLIVDIAKIVLEIIKFSISKFTMLIGGKNAKN